MRRPKERYLISVLLALIAAQAVAQPAGEPPSYIEVFYPSGALRIQAYLYRPPGNGPFPLVIYNHGSREGRERESRAFAYIGRLLAQSGYAVLVPERRGYGRSDGLTFTEEIHRDRGPFFVARMRAESEDVLAALDFLRTLPFVDQRRLGIMGWSFGGIVTIFAASRSDGFRAVVDQAGGALVWQNSPALREALPAAAQQVRAPVLLMVAQNDATTASITTVAEAIRGHNPATELIVYPPFIPRAKSGLTESV
jgi:dienelactone hydrolase